MLKAIAVDDEQTALNWFKEVSEPIETFELSACFTKPQEALQFIEQNEIDIVFLDIEMPSINGLELSETIFEMKPAINVIFVTAYDKYALQAFKTHAIGYLLKPADPDDIVRQTNAILIKRQAKIESADVGNLEISCFGGFHCSPLGDSNKTIHWRTAKAEELFALLVHLQGEVVSKEKVLDLLWPDMEVEKATKNLYATWYYIRDVLREYGHEDLLNRNRSGYQLKHGTLKCDLIEFVKAIGVIESGTISLEQLERAVQLYNGVYFGDRPYEWASNMRAWIDNEFEKIVYRLAEQYRTLGENDKEREILKRLIYHNPLADEAYRLLIELSIRLKDYATATSHYKRYEKILSDELGISPPEYIRQLLMNPK